jgi:hypothetical protein
MPLDSDRWSSDFWARLDVRCRTGHHLFIVRCASMGAPAFCARCARIKCSAGSRWRRNSRCSAVTPDSPVHTGHVRWIIAEWLQLVPEEHRTLSGVHRTVRWIIARRPAKFLKVASSSWSPLVHRTLSGVHRTVRFLQTRGAFGCLFAHLLNPKLDLFIGWVWTFYTCIIYTLGQTS